MKLAIFLIVAALACVQVFAAPQIHVVDNNYNDPSQVHIVDNNYNDPSQVHVVDNNYNDPSQVHVVDNNPSQVHVVDNNRYVVEDTAFYRPTVNGGPGPNQYEPINKNPEFVDGGSKHYTNPLARGGQ